MQLDVHLHYDKLTDSWVVDLRKIGARINILRTHGGCPLSGAEPTARQWADFLGATLTRDIPQQKPPIEGTSSVGMCTSEETDISHI